MTQCIQFGVNQCLQWSLQYVEIIPINHGNNIGCLDLFNWYASTSDRVLTWDMEWKDHKKTLNAPEYVHLYKLPTS